MLHRRVEPKRVSVGLSVSACGADVPAEFAGQMMNLDIEPELASRQSKLSLISPLADSNTLRELSLFLSIIIAELEA